MHQPKRILYIHHAGRFSGATLSLLSLMQHLDLSYFTPMVGLIGEGEVEQMYAAHGVEVELCPAARFAHTTGGWWPLHQPWSAVEFGRWLSQYRRACRNFENLTKRVKPDIVHLNSLTLAPYAPLFSRLGVPTIVHVRESVVDGCLGVRKRWLQQLLVKYSEAVIYICKDNRERFTRTHPRGQVIYNPVDFSKFDRNLDKATVRRELGIPDRARVVLFVGGLATIKGIIPFLQAMNKVLKDVPDLYCLMPFASHTASVAPLRVCMRKLANQLGVYSIAQRVEQTLSNSDLGSRVLRTPFRLDIEKFFAAADVLVVPFMEPHFARPVIEAGAMAKPVVGFRIGGIKEIIADGETGILVPRNDVAALAAATIRLLQDQTLATNMGEAGFQRAWHSYRAEVHAEKVMTLYRQVLS